jgi:hypothetical protein
MKKIRIVTVKMSESDYEKIRIVAGDKGISECIRALIDQAYRGVKEDIKVFQNLDRINQVIERLSVQQSGGKNGMELQYLRAIMETLKLLGTLVIALPDKRKIFTDEVEKIEAILRGDGS